MKQIKNGVLTIAFCVGMGTLAGCGAPAVRVDFQAAQDLNLNQFDEPLPVVIRVYQLSESLAFEEAEFDLIWKSDAALLGESLLGMYEVVVGPGGVAQLELTRHELAGYVAAIAMFRSPGDRGWRIVEPLSTGYITRHWDKAVKVVLNGNTIAIQE